MKCLLFILVNMFILTATMTTLAMEPLMLAKQHNPKGFVIYNQSRSLCLTAADNVKVSFTQDCHSKSSLWNRTSNNKIRNLAKYRCLTLNDDSHYVLGSCDNKESQQEPAINSVVATEQLQLPRQ
ncbi:RICIN domain-containing protein [Paraferrimonas sp. SM1919]|uniref:RICIN domain-containing protein n=1 Tax=Paraferrimonas sp. SM1919 TaxID=2662263 RepID=UPI0013D77DC1|nr:RICIN domain-containing protein [Paraferrimonas sp. SM1919]